MCGIAGWVDFDRDLTSDRDRAVAEAMTRTMACRGPDEERLWLDPHVALGNRRLAETRHTCGNWCASMLTVAGLPR
jgi:asparagine synthase (glutamine-hydrolysing)